MHGTQRRTPARRRTQLAAAAAVCTLGVAGCSLDLKARTDGLTPEEGGALGGLIGGSIGGPGGAAVGDLLGYVLTAGAAAAAGHTTGRRSGRRSANGTTATPHATQAHVQS